jgi:PfaD family protein
VTPSTKSHVVFEGSELGAAIHRVREPVHVVREPERGRIGVLLGPDAPSGCTRLASLPPLYPEWLGERSFAEMHGVRFPYIAGEMANGIATTRMVIAMARAGMLGFFGAAGLSYPRVEAAVDELTRELGATSPWGVNLIHSPSEPELEARVAAMLLARGVTRISASAFMELTPAVVRCAATGLRRDATGRVVRKHHIFAKLSRPEVAGRFMSPPPSELLRVLVDRRELTAEEAALAALVPVAEDVTVEADSGGHTDNQPLGVLLPAILALRDETAARHAYPRPIRVGAAGGLGTPASVAAAFALGAAYVLTGSVNQAAVESGLSEAGKTMLAAADIADVAMAPAADMFELGVTVQVLRRGTMFPTRARRLYDAWVAWPSLEAIPPETRVRLEKEVLGATFDEVWSETRRFWNTRDPAQVERAAGDSKHRMALVFRWYLGRSSRWAIDGDPARKVDYQIWCGPSMGGFNRWVARSFLAEPSRRTVVQIALNLLEGAAVVTRAQQLRSYGVAVPTTAFHFAPRPLS